MKSTDKQHCSAYKCETSAAHTLLYLLTCTQHALCVSDRSNLQLCTVYKSTDCPIRHKIGHFGDVLPNQPLG